MFDSSTPKLILVLYHKYIYSQTIYHVNILFTLYYSGLTMWQVHISYHIQPHQKHSKEYTDKSKCAPTILILEFLLFSFTQCVE